MQDPEREMSTIFVRWDVGSDEFECTSLQMAVGIVKFSSVTSDCVDGVHARWADKSCLFGALTLKR